MNIKRVVFTTGTVWAQEGQTTETMLKRDDGGYDIVYEFTPRPGKRQLLLFPEDARVFEEGLESGGFLSWPSDIYEAPEPQGVRWSLLVEGEGFEELALQGASKAFPAGFPEFVALMDWAFRAAVAHSSQAELRDDARKPERANGDAKRPYEWHDGAIQPDDYPFAHSK